MSHKDVENSSFKAVKSPCLSVQPLDDKKDFIKG